MILITICGRGGSKGVPNKNIREINGKPLIVYTIEVAFAFTKKYPSIIALSTDSARILAISKNLGLNSEYIRPDFLATDTSSKIDVIKDLLFFEENNHGNKFDYIIDLDITSPLRTLKNIEDGFDVLIKHPDAYNLFSVSSSRRNPHFNMVELKPDGYVGMVKPHARNVLYRQAAPEVFDINASFYIYRRKFFDENFSSALTEKSVAFIMKEFCMDIDDEMDFQIIKYLIESNKVRTI